MRKYPKEYLAILEKETQVINNNGVKVILKPSPTESRSGYLDKSEKAIMDGHWSSHIDAEDSNSDDAIEDKIEPTLTEVIEAIRDSMGFANLNLNTEEIYTKFETINDSGNEVGIWRYYPRKSSKRNDRKALVFFHGGGWIGGTTYVVENFCKLIAERADCVVFNIDYSLAPEKPYPNGLNDNYYAVKHIYDNAEKYGIDKEKIAVAGDSAGGNFAAAVSLMARDNNLPMIAMQVLLYPCVAAGDAMPEGYEWSKKVFEMSAEQEEIIKGMIRLGDPELVKEDMFTKCYVNDLSLCNDPYVSPMMAASHKNLPKTILAGAEFDGLRIQTEFYAKQLQDAGVEVRCYRYKGLGHAFIDKLGYLPQTEDLVNVISKAIKEL